MLSVAVNPLGGNAVGMEPNVTLFAAALLLYALFNGIFLPVFYKTAYKVGTAFLKAIIPTSLAMVACEALVHFPGMGFLEDCTAVGQLRLLPLLYIRLIQTHICSLLLRGACVHRIHSCNFRSLLY